MRPCLMPLFATLMLLAVPADAAECRLAPKEVVTRFITTLYLDKQARQAFETSHASFNAGDRGLAIVDILRVDHCRIVEHWDLAQPVPEKSANSNGML